MVMKYLSKRLSAWSETRNHRDEWPGGAAVKLVALFHYLVQSLWASRALLGTAHGLEYQGASLSIHFPAHGDDFPFGYPRGQELRTLSGESSGTEEDPEQIVGVRILQVRAYFEVADGDEAALVEAASGRMDDLWRLSASGLAEVLAWVRVFRWQPWLALSDEQPQIIGLTSVMKLDSGDRLPFSWNPPTVAYMLPGESALLPEDMSFLMAQVNTGAEPPVADTLLADAQELLRGTRTAAQARRPALIAAIACEAKVKEALRRVVSAPAAPLLDIILDNPRDVSLPVRALFDLGAKAACGRSLRDEDRTLYTQIQRLFEVRNAIAHRGETPASDAEARDLIIAARRAFDWLDSLEATP